MSIYSDFEQWFRKEVLKPEMKDKQLERCGDGYKIPGVNSHFILYRAERDFEAWISEHSLSDSSRKIRLERTSDGHFKNEMVNRQWSAWRASEINSHKRNHDRDVKVRGVIDEG